MKLELFWCNWLSFSVCSWLLIHVTSAKSALRESTVVFFPFVKPRPLDVYLRARVRRDESSTYSLSSLLTQMAAHGDGLDIGDHHARQCACCHQPCCRQYGCRWFSSFIASGFNFRSAVIVALSAGIFANIGGAFAGEGFNTQMATATYWPMPVWVVFLL